MKIRQLTVKGKWTGLIQKHIALIRADGVEAVVPSHRDRAGMEADRE